MRPRITAILTTAALGAAGLAVATPAALADGTSKTVLVGDESTTIGTGRKTCVLKPGADCRGVVHRWGVEHHGNLRKAKFTRADLRGADFRGADLRGADFRGAKLRHADLRDARLTGARFGDARRNGRVPAEALPPCGLFCEGADLAGAYLQGANLTNVSFFSANLTFANLDNAILIKAHLTFADLLGASLVRANLTSADLRGAKLVPPNEEAASGELPAPIGGRGQDLPITDYRGVVADLTGANLTGANLTGVNLWLRDAKGAAVGNVPLSGAIWSNTTCPDGTVTSTGC